MTKPAKRIGKRSIERLVRLSTRRFDPIRSDPIEKPLHRDATRRSLADSKVATQLQPAVSNEQRDRDESARLGCARESSIDFGRVYYWSTTMPQNKKKKKKRKKKWSNHLARCRAVAGLEGLEGLEGLAVSRAAAGSLFCHWLTIWTNTNK